MCERYTNLGRPDRIFRGKTARLAQKKVQAIAPQQNPSDGINPAPESDFAALVVLDKTLIQGGGRGIDPNMRGRTRSAGLWDGFISLHANLLVKPYSLTVSVEESIYSADRTAQVESVFL